MKPIEIEFRALSKDEAAESGAQFEMIARLGPGARMGQSVFRQAMPLNEMTKFRDALDGMIAHQGGEPSLSLERPEDAAAGRIEMRLRIVEAILVGGSPVYAAAIDAIERAVLELPPLNADAGAGDA
ncbi:hypothetical protein [Methylosinus sp. LW4]|uniref:hypothetical protein n=1 Tax=Methylosinus sp. LW4 TaxID=136993 RepID=UPI000377C9A6|nr:hypothetical protein [Methylosinus sp. LW4]